MACGWYESVLSHVTAWLAFLDITTPPRVSYQQRCSVAQSQMRRSNGLVVSAHSNHEYGLPRLSLAKLDLSSFDDIEYQPGGSTVTVGSAVTIRQLLCFLLQRDLTLAVLPDLGHLTMGGIVAGVGGGSRSFKNGYFHELLTEMDVLLKTGDIETLNPEHELFYALPNTLGTLGYILRMKVKVVSLPGRYVATQNLHFEDWDTFAAELRLRQNDQDTDFLDGTVFGPSEFVLVVGKYTKTPPKMLDNFLNDKIYWDCIRSETGHAFEVLDYIYRWDTDLYYTTSVIPGALGSALRRTFWRRFVPQSAIPCIKRCVGAVISQGTVQEIMQDVMIPFDRAGDFFRWFTATTPVYPVYICPARTTTRKFLFWPPSDMLDFGIGYGVDTPTARKKTIQIEQKMVAMGGKKLLYTRTHLSARDFWQAHDPDECYDFMWDKCNRGDQRLTTYDKVS